MVKIILTLFYIDSSSMLNKINMDAIRSLPKVLDGIEDIRHGGNSNDVLAQYKRNMKEFIRIVTNQVSQIIDRYQQKISELKEENRRLKIDKEQFKELPLETARKTERNSRNREVSSSLKFIHSKKRTPNLQLMQTAKSRLFQDDIRFSAVLSKYKGKTDSRFPVELINPEPGEDEDFQGGKSHFEITSNIKKQREQQLVSFLQTGTKSMNYTTKRFLESIGRGKEQQNESKEFQLELNKDHSDSSASTKKNEEVLNQSLGNICNSLDKSYISKRARSNKKKKSNQIQAQAKRKQKQEEEVAKMMKGKGIKNLLSRLRQNVQASPKKGVQMIKSSKLISCGPTRAVEKELNLSTSKRNSSKVMINPVPVDIVRKSMVAKKERSQSPQPPSPIIRHSILKQSSKGDRNSPTKSILKHTSQILSKSISGISAIEFAD